MVKIVDKVWGQEHWAVNNELYCFKTLLVLPKHAMSMHMHKQKDETFIHVYGDLLYIIERDGVPKYYTLKADETLRIPPYTYHTIVGITAGALFEVSTPHQDEDSYRTTVRSRKLTDDDYEEYKYIYEKENRV